MRSLFDRLGIPKITRHLRARTMIAIAIPISVLIIAAFIYFMWDSHDVLKNTNKVLACALALGAAAAWFIAERVETLDAQADGAKEVADRAAVQSKFDEVQKPDGAHIDIFHAEIAPPEVGKEIFFSVKRHLRGDVSATISGIGVHASVVPTADVEKWFGDQFAESVREEMKPGDVSENTTNFPCVIISQEDMDRINSGEAVLVAMAKFNYVDEAGNARRTELRGTYDPSSESFIADYDRVTTIERPRWWQDKEVPKGAIKKARLSVNGPTVKFAKDGLTAALLLPIRNAGNVTARIKSITADSLYDGPRAHVGEMLGFLRKAKPLIAPFDLAPGAARTMNVPVSTESGATLKSIYQSNGIKDDTSQFVFFAGIAYDSGDGKEVVDEYLWTYNEEKNRLERNHSGERSPKPVEPTHTPPPPAESR